MAKEKNLTYPTGKISDVYTALRNFLKAPVFFDDELNSINALNTQRIK